MTRLIIVHANYSTHLYTLLYQYFYNFIIPKKSLQMSVENHLRADISCFQTKEYPPTTSCSNLLIAQRVNMSLC